MRNVLIVILTLMLVVNSVYAKEVVVEIYKKAFIPKYLTIEVGDTVIWRNIEKRQYHNVWFKALLTEEPDYIFPNERYQLVFNNIGEFSYECGPHPKMKGVVIVTKK
ncbi:MAG: plastocyanin [Alteromonadaceae bacterium]|jgi:plastocyanin